MTTTFAPLFRSRPPHRWTNGDLAARVGADLGLPPDEEQRWLLDSIYAEQSLGRPASFEVVVIAPRQNIKTSTFGIAALTDLFIFGVRRHLWSSHLGSTTKSTFADFRAWISSNHEYSDLVTFYEGHQDLAIVLKESDARIEFTSRTGRASRGMTGVERVTLDEGLYLEPKHIGAVFPTMLTRPGSQVRTASSAGLLMSEQLRSIRDRGRAGAPRVAYIEYGAPCRPCEQRACSHSVGTSGCALDDRSLWWQANCALWSGRITEEALEEQRAMPPREFMREFLSWWEDPQVAGGALPAEAWGTLADAGAKRGHRVVFGLDLTGERDVWIAVAWDREDGGQHVMLANEGQPLPAYRAVEECRRLTETWGGAFATSAFAEEFDDKGIPFESLSGLEFAAACGLVDDGIREMSLWHGNQGALNDAIRAAKWRPEGSTGERAFVLRDCPEVGPAAAVARALWGLKRGIGGGFNVW